MLDASTITLLFAGTSLAGAALSVALALKLADARSERDDALEAKANLKGEIASVRNSLAYAQEQQLRQAARIAEYRAADQKRADQRIAASHARVAKLAAAKANGARV